MLKYPPLFLVGSERSGTTLLRLMLDHHPKIAFLSESEYFVDFEEGFHNFHSYLKESRYFREHKFTINPKLSYTELLNDFFMQLQERTRKPFVGATVHKHFDRLISIWPNARFIHLLRDPRDVSRSCIGMGWAGNVWHGVERWVVAENLWDTFSKQLGEDQSFTLKFEELIENPEKTLTELCDWIGTPYDPAMLSYPNDSTYGPTDPSLIYQWKKKLSPKEIQLVESRCWKKMKVKGYPLSGDSIKEISSFQQFFLNVQNKMGKAKFRSQRYGRALFLKSLIAERLPFPNWKKQIKNEIERVDVKYLK